MQNTYWLLYQMHQKIPKATCKAVIQIPSDREKRVSLVVIYYRHL